LANAAGAWFEQHPENERLLLILDQLEDLLVADPELSHENFVTQLLRLLDSPHPITVVLVVQEAFYSRLAQQAPKLAQEWLPGEGLVELSSRLRDLTREELVNIVQKPATTAGLTFEDDKLVERIVNDAMEAAPLEGTQSARTTVLPLLEYALSRLCENRQHGMLTHEAYDDMEGLTGHLTLWADKAYYSLADELQRLAQRILIDLVEPGDESRGLAASRRRRSLAELYHDESDSAVFQQVVQQLSTARLLVTIADQARDQEYVELIHDELLHEWRPLRRWLKEENRRFEAWHGKIMKQAKDWWESNPDDPRRREDNKLLRHPELGEAKEWSSKRGSSLNQLEREFIHASIERTQQQTAREEYRKAVAEAWTDKKLDEEEVASLRDLANKGLKLSPSTAAAVERDTMGGTKKAILKRQERLNELYAKARRLHRDQEWQQVVKVFDEIHDSDQTYPDQEELLVSAREELEAQERTRKVAAIYAEGQRHMDAGELQQALESFEEVMRLEPGYRETEALRTQVRHELEEGEKASQYREALKSVWADGELRSDEAESLMDLANNRLELSPKTAVDIQKEVMGDTIQGILQKQGQAARERTVEEPRATNAARRKAEELGVDLSQIQGTGSGGLITIRDVVSPLYEQSPASSVEQPQFRQPTEKPDATDAARQKADELGVDLSKVEGTGPEGRITVKDVTSAAYRPIGSAGNHPSRAAPKLNDRRPWWQRWLE
jgi:pyruvate/2-oxoglutarate dehydrogenase complex dihydrolipoamide acyltransferase (E2) component